MGIIRRQVAMRGIGSVNRFIFYFCIFRLPPRVPRGKVIVKDKLIRQAKRLQDKMDLIEAQRQSATPIIEQQPDYGEFLKLETESGGLVEVESRPSGSGRGKKKLRDFLWEDAG